MRIVFSLYKAICLIRLMLQYYEENPNPRRFVRAKAQKTPPDGEKGGEKQYKDYEKNPTLFFLNASASKTMQR